MYGYMWACVPLGFCQTPLTSPSIQLVWTDEPGSNARSKAWQEDIASMDTDNKIGGEPSLVVGSDPPRVLVAGDPLEP